MSNVEPWTLPLSSLTRISATILSSMPFLVRILVIEAKLLGFGFEGPIRGPFAEILAKLASSNAHIVSIDVPSGWPVDVERPHVDGLIKPSLLISLTAPKMCVRHLNCRHYLGGRFLTPHLIKSYALDIPEYSGASQFIRLN